jgi:carotenoid cleavage dioxygenase-like enzyme
LVVVRSFYPIRPNRRPKLTGGLAVCARAPQTGGMADISSLAEHPYLRGNYAPVPDEITVTDLETIGVVPAALNGVYMRIGPNPAAPALPYHWFLGDGMVHGIRLRDCRAESYRNRWVRTAPMSEQLGEAPVSGPAQPMYDASNTALTHHAGRVLAMTEGCYPYELSRDLDTQRRAEFGAPLEHGLTAHPKIDPRTGEMLGFSYWWVEPFLIYHVFGPDGQLRVSEPIDLPAPVSMHDFAFTENYVLFFDQPAVFDLDRAIAGTFPFSWQPENGARVGVLPRDGKGADIQWFDTEVCYTFHPMNAFEDADGSIVVDVPRLPSVYEDSVAITGATKNTLERWTIDRDAGKVRQDTLDDTPQDFCRIDERILGTPHRFGYTAAIGAGMPYDATSAFKHDVRAGTRVAHDFGPGRHPGEFVFVGDPDRAADEDGGWLLGLVHDDASERTSLMILDAQDFAGAPAAEVRLPRRVPYGFHGLWAAGF